MSRSVVSRWVFAAVTLLVVTTGLLWPGLPALAQDAEPLRLSALEIALWPEFDEPELLVIFQGRLAEDVSLPTELTLTMPKEVGEPHAVASVDEAGQLLTAAYDVREVGDDIEVTYTSLEHRAFQFEYYWDILQMEGKERQFGFSYRLDASVDDFSLVLQQPSGSMDVVLEPPAAESYPGFADLTYHRLSFGAVDVGQVVSWRVSYNKSSPQLSLETLPTSAPVSSPARTESTSSVSATGAVIVIGVALAAVVGGLWFVGSRRQAEHRRPGPRAQWTKPSKPRKRKDRKGVQSRMSPSFPIRPRPSGPSRSGKPTSPAPSDPEGGFCHRCGAAQKPDAMFCHKCGTRRRGG